MKTTNSQSGEASNQQGFASIVIALTIIVVLALLTVGFAQVARHEQQGALDKQVANQAYYAAESGINDAVQDINSGTICDTLCTGSQHSDTSSTTCMTPATATSGTKTLPSTALTAQPVINGTGNVSYSCLLVSLQNKNIKFSDTPANNGQYLQFSTTAGLSSLTVQWGSDDGQSTPVPAGTYAAGSQLPPESTWNSHHYPPLVLFSLTPISTPFSQLTLANNTFNVYLYPQDSTGSYTASIGGQTVSAVSATSGQGQIVPGNCGHNGATAAEPCSVTITHLSGGTSYLLHYISYYDATNFQQTGTDSSGNSLNFIGQAQIDVTGKAQNVLKRIQVTMVAPSTPGSIGTQALVPDSALSGQNLCKRFDTYSGTSTPDTSAPGCDLN